METAVVSKYITFDELEQSEIGGVYCLNTTPEKRRSTVVFTVAKLHGTGADNVFIPSMMPPIELTTMVTRKQLLNSSEFRRAVSRKLITLITKEYFDQLMREEGAQEIVAREIHNLTRAPEQDASQGRSDEAGVDDDAGVSPKVQLMLDQLLAGDITERTLINNFRSAGNLTKEDAKFVWKKTADYSMVRSFIRALREEKGW